jgi:bacillithiol biosynthesis deacetylase BshB1
MTRVVCVGAHPDDVEIGMGGAVSSLVRGGADVLIVDLTDGEPTPRGTRERRRAEAAEAARLLGCRRLTLDLPNRYLFDSVEARTALAEVLRAERPAALFAPFPEDAHPDHVAASAIAGGARFYAKLTKTKMTGESHYPARLYRYMAVHLRLVREPSFIADISEDLPTKLAALREYCSQFGDDPANQGVVAHVERAARFWGDVGRVEAGEPFFCLEPPVVTSILDVR